MLNSNNGATNGRCLSDPLAGGLAERLADTDPLAAAGDVHGGGERTSNALIRVLLVHDEELIRSALAALLGREDDVGVVAQAAGSRAAVEAALAHRPDVAVLHWDASDTDGLELTGELGAALPTCAVVVLAGRVRTGQLRRVLVAGAKGVLPTGAQGGTLADAIRRVHAGGRYVDPGLAAEALTAQECPLAPRELEVLRLAQYDTPVAEVARRVHLSKGTVRNYLAAVVHKLGVGSRAEAFRLARDNGWL